MDTSQNTRQMEAEDFLDRYASRSGIDRAMLLDRGRVVATCACGEEICEGWQLVPEDCLLPWRNETVVISG